MSDLVERLRVAQPITARLRPEPSVERLKAAIDRGYVHVRFPGTRGGTELGVRLDRAATDLSAADFQAGRGSVTLVGHLVLDYVPVRFSGVLALDTLAGTGALEPAESPASPS